jgi:hypothetical protein
MRPILVLAIFLLVAACQLSLPGGGGKTDAPNAVTGDPIEVTPLDAPVKGVAAGEAPEAEAPDAEAPDAEAPDAEAPDAEATDIVAPDPAAEEAAVEEAPPEVVPPVEIVNPALQTPEARACVRRGGRYLTVGGSSIARACVKPTRDGGDRCERGTQCDGECLARSGTCAPVTPLFGCTEVFQDNGNRVTLCIE